jgi:hypothetical protein
LVIAVPHDEYKNILLREYLSMFKNVGRKIIIDLYGIIDKAECEMLDMEYWSL